MSKNTDSILVKIDFWILDTLFQPLANRFPGEKMNLRVGTNLVLGSVIFSFAFLLLPMFLYGVGLFHSTYNLMSCVMMSCFYAYVHQSQGLVREGFVNPLRYHLFGIRIISIPFALYSVYIWMTAGTLVGRITLFYCISNILSVCGLYLVSCNVNPPKKQEHRKAVFSENPFS